jgi:hypothetical protein
MNTHNVAKPSDSGTRTRRAILAGAAMLPALAIIPATALPAIGGTDPIFAAIERCRVVEAAGLIEPAPPEAKDIRPAREALARTSPTTPAGLVALTGFLREQTATFGEFYFDTTSDEPATFASSLDDAVRGMAGLKPWGGVADAQAVDPVFAVIKHSERLWAEWTSVSITEPKQLRSPDYAAWDKRNTAAGDAYNDAFDELLATKPTTRAGAAALIAHCLSEKCRFSAGTESGGVAKTLLRTLAKAMPALA